MLPLLPPAGLGARAREARSGWRGAAGMAGLSHSLLSNGQAGIAGEMGGAGQPAAESENFPLPEPAAGCHLGRGSASSPNLPSLWKRGRKLCAEEIASPSIPRLSVKNPASPAFEKGRDKKCHTLGCFQRNLLLWEPLQPRKISIPLVLSFYFVITFTFKN